MRPEKLAVRAVNQYRRRDILAYLGLRYYLQNEAAKSDVWARNVSTYLVNSRVNPIYFCSHHFKEISDSGDVVYRNIYVPGPNEILAETVLLYECSLYPSFRSLSCVYSYQFPDAHSKEGIFRSYFPRYRSRHQSIANACLRLGEATVRYTDIRKFYPSITIELARDAWRSACESSKVQANIRELGNRLLDEHYKMAVENQEGLGILTGPMFSHLIASLVLYKIDNIMQKRTEGNYWRYVDDIVLVGDESRVNNEREFLKSTLSDLGLSLHDENKDFAVDSKTWLEGMNDFSDPKGGLWMHLISNIKRFLIAKPECKGVLSKAFIDNGINIPIMDYSAAVGESSYLEMLADFLQRNPWFPKSIQNISVKKLVEDAIRTRNAYLEKIKILLDEDPQIKGYKRKRLLPKLRFYAGRLSYLAVPDTLLTLSSSLSNYPEMLVQSTIMNAIQTQDVTALLKLGANAVQAAAQIFRIRRDSVKCSSESLDDVEIQGIAILKLNGVDTSFPGKLPNSISTDHLNQFANGNDPFILMKSGNLFIKEIACLRGTGDLLRHQVLMNTAFDRDEHMVFDVITHLRDSSYF